MVKVLLRWAIVALLFLAVTPAADAQLNVQSALSPLGFCQLTLTGTAAGLSSCTGGIPLGAHRALIRVETANARWRDDGTAPTTSAGFLMATTDTFILNYTGPVSAIQFIAVTGSPVLDVSFYK